MDSKSWITLTKKRMIQKNEEKLFEKYIKYYNGNKDKALLAYAYALHKNIGWEGFEELQKGEI